MSQLSVRRRRLRMLRWWYGRQARPWDMKSNDNDTVGK